MPRSVPEWIGRSDDHRPPESVRRRVGAAQDWICPLCDGEIIGDGQCDHIVELADEGENRESNLRMLCGRCHKLKSARSANARADARGREIAHRMKREPSRRPMAGSRASKFKRRLGPGGRQFTIERGSDG